jgi:hypothetical protein
MANIATKKNTPKSKEDNFAHGSGIAIAFILSGLFLYLSPSYYGYKIVSYIVSSIFVIFGIVGLGIELNKIINRDKAIRLDNLGLGLGMLLAWGILYNFYPYPLLNFFTFALLFLGLYGVSYGTISIILGIKKVDGKSNKLVSILLLMAQIATTTAALYELFNKTGILKKLQ